MKKSKFYKSILDRIDKAQRIIVKEEAKYEGLRDLTNNEFISQSSAHVYEALGHAYEITLNIVSDIESIINNYKKPASISDIKRKLSYVTDELIYISNYCDGWAQISMNTCIYSNMNRTAGRLDDCLAILVDINNRLK